VSRRHTNILYFLNKYNAYIPSLKRTGFTHLIDKKMRKINQIVIHCSATIEGEDKDAAWIRNLHVEKNGWSDIGYHFVVKLDGTVEKGRPLERPGAHVRGHNSDTIGVCYIGGLDKTGQPKDTRTEEQKLALNRLIMQLRSMFGYDLGVKGHRDYSPDINHDGEITPDEWLKACPCFDAIPEYNDLEAEL
jgi:hypothetical protein